MKTVPYADALHGAARDLLSTLTARRRAAQDVVRRSRELRRRSARTIETSRAVNARIDASRYSGSDRP
jgi:hypothetical protein